MDNEIKKSFDVLKSQLGDLPAQSDAFIENYIRRATVIERIDYSKDIREIGEECYIPLPTDNRDPVFIRRLLDVFIRLNYPDFVMNDSTSTIFDRLIGIITGTHKQRGLIVYGPVGSGKTLALLIWIHFRTRIINESGELQTKYLQQTPKKRRFTMYNPTDLTRHFLKYGFDFFNYTTAPDVLVLDDIGIQTIITYYGTQTNMIEQLIFARYDAHKRNPDLEIYATTNLTALKLKTALGDRAFSRLIELAAWDPGQLIADDHRMKQPVGTWPDIRFYNPLPKND